MTRTFERFAAGSALLAGAGRHGVQGALFVVVHVARLSVLDPKTNVIRVAAVASGLVIVPAFYALLGWTLHRR